LFWGRRSKRTAGRLLDEERPRRGEGRSRTWTRVSGNRKVKACFSPQRKKTRVTGNVEFGPLRGHRLKGEKPKDSLSRRNTSRQGSARGDPGLTGDLRDSGVTVAQVGEPWRVGKNIEKKGSSKPPGRADIVRDEDVSRIGLHFGGGEPRL